VTWRSVLRTLAGKVLDDRGQDLLEYGLLMSLIVIVAMAAVKTLGDTVKTVLWDVIAAFHI
jgi:Flp pilus assembly pilin Flp